MGTNDEAGTEKEAGESAEITDLGKFHLTSLDLSFFSPVRWKSGETDLKGSHWLCDSMTALW